jgi:hypothetical protein
VPWLANIVTQTPGLRWLAKAIGDIAQEPQMPRFARRTFQRLYPAAHDEDDKNDRARSAHSLSGSSSK